MEFGQYNLVQSPMKKLLFALALAALCGPASAQGPIVGPGQYVLCTGAATLPVGFTTITQLIAAKTGTSIFICGWHITNTGAAGSLTFSIGSGSNCGTGTAVVVPAINVTSSAPSADHIDYASLQISPQSGVAQALCATATVATISVVVWFNQF